MSQGRRRHARIAARAEDVRHAQYSCLDISESGLKLSAKGKVAVGSVITVQLNTLDTHVDVRCKVMWCREASSIFESDYHFGVMFENLSIQHQFKLRELIESRS